MSAKDFHLLKKMKTKAAHGWQAACFQKIILKENWMSETTLLIKRAGGTELCSAFWWSVPNRLSLRDGSIYQCSDGSER